jgi:hypothetical protein
LAKRPLVCHPGARAPAVSSCDVKVSLSESQTAAIEYVVIGDIAQLSLAPRTTAARADNLWATTCFELFVLSSDGGYCEFNFSPSTRWAAYHFASYRKGMTPLSMVPPTVSVECSQERLALRVDLPIAPCAAPWPERIGVSAVIEAKDGTKSYWALAHPIGKPDFHHRDCFALTLPAPGAT